MFDTLPKEITATLDWPWADIEPYFQDLLARPLTAANVDAWLADWTALGERVGELHQRRYVATTLNTADQEAERLFNEFLDTISQPAQAAEQKLKEKLLTSGLEPAGLAMPLRRMRTDAALFRQANLPLKVQEQKLGSQYNKVISAQTVQWEGKEVTISQLRPVFQRTDRAQREQAWRLSMARSLADRQAINHLWQQFLPLRRQIAANADFGDYRAYKWQQLHRFDYTPADCATFHQAIEDVVVPAAKRLYEKRRQQLGVSTLRPWDVDPLGRPPLQPFSDVSDLQAKASSIFRQVDPQLGDYFDTMAREGLLDLDNRKNKAPGGYCTTFTVAKRPFIFVNAVGLHDDVQTLLHESGHAFHAFEKCKLPYLPQREVGAEFNEVASMAMELLAAPYLPADKGGLYSTADAARALVEHLEGNIHFWPYMAVVDAFQHWAYENPDEAMHPANCDAAWGRLWQRFMPGVDWSGLEQEMMTGWHRKLHIYRHPFYYVEYGLAQLGSTLIWANALQDQAGALAAYRRALALGGTVSLPDLYAAAGVKFAFDAETLGKAVGLIEKTIAALEG